MMFRSDELNSLQLKVAANEVRCDERNLWVLGSCLMRLRPLLLGLMTMFFGNCLWALEDARSKVQFIVATSTETRSVVWPSGKSLISFPFNEKNRPTGLAIFEG